MQNKKNTFINIFERNFVFESQNVQETVQESQETQDLGLDYFMANYEDLRWMTQINSIREEKEIIPKQAGKLMFVLCYLIQKIDYGSTDIPSKLTDTKSIYDFFSKGNSSRYGFYFENEQLYLADQQVPFLGSDTLVPQDEDSMIKALLDHFNKASTTGPLTDVNQKSLSLRLGHFVDEYRIKRNYQIASYIQTAMKHINFLTDPKTINNEPSKFIEFKKQAIEKQTALSRFYKSQKESILARAELQRNVELKKYDESIINCFTKVPANKDYAPFYFLALNMEGEAFINSLNSIPDAEIFSADILNIFSKKNVSKYGFFCEDGMWYVRSSTDKKEYTDILIGEDPLNSINFDRLLKFLKNYDGDLNRPNSYLTLGLNARIIDKLVDGSILSANYYNAKEKGFAEASVVERTVTENEKEYDYEMLWDSIETNGYSIKAKNESSDGRAKYLDLEANGTGFLYRCEPDREIVDFTLDDKSFSYISYRNPDNLNESQIPDPSTLIDKFRGMENAAIIEDNIEFKKNTEETSELEQNSKIPLPDSITGLESLVAFLNQSSELELQKYDDKALGASIFELLEDEKMEKIPGENIQAKILERLGAKLEATDISRNIYLAHITYELLVDFNKEPFDGNKIYDIDFESRPITNAKIEIVGDAVVQSPAIVSNSGEEATVDDENNPDKKLGKAMNKIFSGDLGVKSLTEGLKDTLAAAKESPALKELFLTGDSSGFDEAFKGDPNMNGAMKMIVEAVAELLSILSSVGMLSGFVEGNDLIASFYKIDQKSFEHILSNRLDPKKKNSIKIARASEALTIDFSKAPFDTKSFTGQIKARPNPDVSARTNTPVSPENKITLYWVDDSGTRTPFGADEKAGKLSQESVNSGKYFNIPTDPKQLKNDKGQHLLIDCPIGTMLQEWSCTKDLNAKK